MTTERIIGVIGSGRANPNTIEDALNELVSHSEFVLPWYGGKPCDSLDRVYTAIIDFDHPYHIVGAVIPKSLTRTAMSSEETIDPSHLVIRRTKELGGDTILVLWDDTPETEKHILEAHSNGMRLLDLTNGMAPIDVLDAEEPSEVAPIVEEEVKVDEEDPGAFTADELRSQPIASLRRQAKLAGITHDKNATKEELVDLLVNGLGDAGLVVAEPEEVVQKFLSPQHATLTLTYDDDTRTVNLPASAVVGVMMMLDGVEQLFS